MKVGCGKGGGRKKTSYDVLPWANQITSGPLPRREFEILWSGDIFIMK